MALFMVGAIGLTAVALSESERDYYRHTGRLMMDYLGTKNGEDIYRDRTTGLYYADNGWDVRRVGKVGWRPHPVDLERLKSKLVNYSPAQVPFCGYILATYIGKEDQLWSTIFNRYELPPKPKEPHFSRALRKARFAEYDKEMEEWEAEAAKKKQEFRDECASWELRKEEYSDEHSHAAVGAGLLLEALGSSDQPVMRQSSAVFKITVPTGKKPGDTIKVQVGSTPSDTVEIMIPAGSAPGTEIQFEVPSSALPAPSAVAAPVATAPPPALGVPDSLPSQNGSSRGLGGSSKGLGGSSRGWGWDDAPTATMAAPPPAVAAPPPAVAAPPPAVAAPPPAVAAPAASKAVSRPKAPEKSAASSGAPPPAVGAPAAQRSPPPAIQPSISFKTT